MKIGHINLAESFDETAVHFLSLVEALQRHGTEQYVVVRNTALAKRLDHLEKVTVGPVVRTSVTASCLIPHVDIAHVHNSSARQAGLLLTLTRSIPFVMTLRTTRSMSAAISRNPFIQSVYKRAAGMICMTQPDAETISAYQPSAPVTVIADVLVDTDSVDDVYQRGCDIAAAEHLKFYHRAVNARRIPTMLL